MILNPAKTLVAYRCPHCGAGVLSMVGVFSLSGDLFKLKCDCGKSELLITRESEDRLRLTVPCILCPTPHSFTVRSSLFFGDRDLFTLACPYSDVNLCFIGEENHVKAELARTELELLDLLEQNGVSDFSALHKDAEELLTDPQIFDIVLFVIHDLDAEGKIYCRCHPAPDPSAAAQPQPTVEESEERAESPADDTDYEVEVTADGIRVTCQKCGASRLIPTDSLLGAHAFLHCDQLYLE
jgi:predicted RNA-binding Zn-ribbon protein involved in translation (DUF1610 family)